MARLRAVKPPETLHAAVTAALAAMPWLTAADGAMVALALSYAGQIDAAGDAKTVAWIGPHLGNVLRSLGGAPGDRKALGLTEAVRGKLAEIRDNRK